MNYTTLYKADYESGEVLERNKRLGRRGEKILKACLESQIHRFYNDAGLIDKGGIELEIALGYSSPETDAERSLGLWANEVILIKMCVGFKAVILVNDRRTIDPSFIQRVLYPAIFKRRRT